MPRAGCPVADVDLTIPATRELLDGWCGPVEVETRAFRWRRGVVVGGRILHWGVRWHDEDVTDETVAHVRLDLTRTEVYDRVCRVLLGDRYERRWRSADDGADLVLRRGRFASEDVLDDAPADPLPVSYDWDDTARLPDGEYRRDRVALRLLWLLWLAHAEGVSRE